MKDLSIPTEALNAILAYHLIEMAQSLLKGVPGPEQGLVGESRSDRRQGHAEDAQPGERGVGEIAVATEFIRATERKKDEALRQRDSCWKRGLITMADQYDWEIKALTELLDDFKRTLGERSDLANDQIHP